MIYFPHGLFISAAKKGESMFKVMVPVDGAAIIAVIGVVFSVVLALITATVGNRILGSYNLRIRKYELFFEQKCAAFIAYIEYTSRIWATSDLDLSLGPDFEIVDRRARLFAGQNTRAAMAQLNAGLIVWAKASFDEDGTPNVIELFSKVTSLMQEELAEEANGGRPKKK